MNQRNSKLLFSKGIHFFFFLIINGGIIRKTIHNKTIQIKKERYMKDRCKKKLG